MNKTIKIIFALIFIIVAGLGIFFYYHKSNNEQLGDKETSLDETIVGTYIGHLANDVYILTISSDQGESVSGTLDIKNFEKDNSTGILKGTYKNGIILADYTFQSEGMESTSWVAFKKTTDGFIRGFGDVGPETKAESIDINKLTFDSSVVYKFSNTIVNKVVFSCKDGKNIKSDFYKDRVYISISDGRNMSLPQVLSGSGARYANFNESVVFWNKGDTAFVDEKGTITYKDCVIKNI